MQQKTKNIILKVLGIFFIFYGISAMVYSILRGNPAWVFWLCYIGMILIGIGALTKNSFLIASQLNILTIPLVLWIVDFFLVLITGNGPLGIAQYFFDEMLIVARLISLEHLFLVPLGFFLIYLIGLKRKDSWKISTVQLIIVFTIQHLLKASESNVNCAFENCYSFLPQFIATIPGWFVINFAMVFIVVFIINNIFVDRKELLWIKGLFSGRKP